jgi:hypothetical protein
MAEPDIIAQIDAQLRRLPSETVAIVYDFVAFLTQRQEQLQSIHTMLASEEVLGRDWNLPEEDTAWEHL